MSRSEADALKKDECLQLIEQLGEAQPRRGVLMVELKAMIKELSLFEREGTGKATPEVRKASCRTRHDGYGLQYPTTTREDT